MITKNTTICPNCGGQLSYYDKVPRIKITKGGKKQLIKVRRFVCNDCNKIHREIPKSLYPYKHYEAEIIKGVKEGLITSKTLGYEDYPCEMTMLRWAHSQKLTKCSNNMRG